MLLKGLQKVRLKYNTKKKFQNIMDLALDLSDLVYILGDDKLLKKINADKSLKAKIKKSNTKIIDINSYDQSEKMEAYNQMKSDFQNLVK